MKKFINILAILTVVIASIAILNGLFCIVFILMDNFDFGYYRWYRIGEYFYIFEIMLTVCATIFIVLLQSLWIYYQINKTH